MLDQDTIHAVWVESFIICGIGTGMAINLPYTAVSAVLDEVNIVTGNGELSLLTGSASLLADDELLLALLQFAFQLGGAVSLCVAQALFIGKLETNGDFPEESPTVMSDAGAYGSPGLSASWKYTLSLGLAYQAASRAVFMFLLVASALAFLISFGFEHKNLKKVEKERNHVIETSMPAADET